ncbi:TadE/TadG family type IV pilus assembly protein [Sphingomonas sp.]|uniref:TadE/TadG family type IV pilus assembly protein n=1 Tax=Sphingomonas sp. TaxID=28214 RepID=UPI002DD638B0|nr:TadE/TadG family type IV pilus assembly protein [Sphingomonas sp.]
MTAVFAPLLRRLRQDTRGATIVEFAIVAPVMCLMLVGAFDVAHTLYTRGMLQGVVQKIARDSTLEGQDTASAQTALDEKVTRQAKALANNASIDITRRYYRTFADAAAQKPEPFTDTNGNGRCDANEPYQDENRNSVWDIDGGNTGQGGAKDAVLYTVEMSFPRMLPLWKLVGGSDQATVTAVTVLKNQPFGDQGAYGSAVVRNCP